MYGTHHTVASPLLAGLPIGHPPHLLEQQLQHCALEPQHQHLDTGALVQQQPQGRCLRCVAACAGTTVWFLLCTGGMQWGRACNAGGHQQPSRAARPYRSYVIATRKCRQPPTGSANTAGGQPKGMGALHSNTSRIILGAESCTTQEKLTCRSIPSLLQIRDI